MFNIMTMLQCFATFCDIFLSINEFGNGVHTLLIYWFCEAKCSHPDKLASPFTRTWHHHCIFTERFCIQRIARNVRSKCSWRSGQNVRIEAVVASDASVALDKKNPLWLPRLNIEVTESFILDKFIEWGECWRMRDGLIGRATNRSQAQLVVRTR